MSIFFFSLVIIQLSYPGKVRPIDLTPISLPLEQVALHAGHKVFVGVETNIALIVGNPQRILGQQLRPHLVPLLNIIIILITYQIIVCYLIKLLNILSRSLKVEINVLSTNPKC